MTEQTEDNKLVKVVAAVTAGSIVGMMLKKKGITIGKLIDGDGSEIGPAIRQLTELGVDVNEVADDIITAICGLFLQKDNAVQGMQCIANILWTTLGDPENNGQDPPQRYKDVAQGLYVWFISALDPAVMTAYTKQAKEESSNG